MNDLTKEEMAKIRAEFERMGSPLPETEEEWLAEWAQCVPLETFIDDFLRADEE
jgi:hypothetical protein